MKMGFKKYNPEVGSRPGTLAIPPDSPPPKIMVVQYDRAAVNSFPIQDAKQLQDVHVAGRVTWVDVQGLGDEALIRAVGAAFELHPVALENAVNVPQRAKTELYEHHQLVIARTPTIGEDGEILTPQVCFVIGDNFLLTFQERYFGFFDKVRQRLEEGTGPMRGLGPDYLAYAMIDAMIDRYYPITQRVSDRLDDLEDVIVDSPHPAVLRRIQLLRRQLAILRRVGWPQRDAVSAMLREQSPFFRDKTKIYLRDTHDHISQIVELIDSSREMASDLADAYLSNVSHRSNEIMKVLTLMASIFIPLTFVAGIYGMNFENMPELSSRRGYFVVLAVMLVIATGMVGFFRRRGWIGLPSPPILDRDEDDEPN